MPSLFAEMGKISVEGAMLTRQSEFELQYKDQKGALCRLTMDLPNAMFLLNILAQVQRDTGAKVPTSPPNG